MNYRPISLMIRGAAGSLIICFAAVVIVRHFVSVVTTTRCQPWNILLAMTLTPLPLQSVADGRVLLPGTAIERQLSGSRSDTYEVTLKAGQFVDIVVNQRGVDVAMTISGPDGKQLAEVDGPNGMHGPERLVLIAETAGVYRLVVHPYRDTGPAGRYEIKIEALREATSADRIHVDAQNRLIEAQQLWAKRTADSLKEALPKFEESLSLWRTLGDRWGEADVLWYLADVQNLLQEPGKALDILEKLLALRRSLADVRGEAAALEHIASNYRFLSEYQKALEYQTEALRLARSVHDEELGGFLSEMGLIYIRLGEPRRALEYFEEALPVHRANGLRDLEAIALWDIGNVYHSSGELQKALTYYAQALPMVTTLGMPRHQASVLGSMGVVYKAQGDIHKAIEHFQQSLELSRKVGHRSVEASALTYLGEAYISLGNSERALEVLGQALVLQRAIRDRDFEAVTLAGMARAEETRGNLTTARKHLETALEIVESLRSTVAQEGLRATYLASKEDQYKLYLDLLMRLHAQQPSRVDDNIAAFETSERWRARSLLEILAEARADIRHGADAALLGRERHLQDQINTRAERQVQLLSAKRTQQAEVVGKQLDALIAEYQQVQGEIRAKSPRYAALTQPRPLTTKEIQRELLDGDSLLLEYSLGAERSYVWAVTPDALTSHVLPKRAEVEALARQLYELLTARNQHSAGESPQGRVARLNQAEAEYQKVSNSLSQMLLGPVATELETKRLIIVSDGALQYVPFGALPAPQATLSTQDEKQDLNVQPRVAAGVSRSDTRYRPLIVDHEIVVLPSASVLHVLRRELGGRTPARKSVAVLADPVFSPDDPRLQRAPRHVSKQIDQSGAQVQDSSPSDVERSALESGGTVFRRLRFTRQEAEAVTALTLADDSLKAVDFAASRAMATSPELRAYRIVHFATHGLLNNHNPELSGIVLSLVDPAGQPQDGFLRLHDIYNLRLGAELVVLSACRTALGREIKGEGLVGLTRGFMYAGVPRVLASLWNVDDRATAQLMKQLYVGVLREGQPPAAALRAAQVSMWKSKLWQSPYYWAAFVMQGEWK